MIRNLIRALIVCAAIHGGVSSADHIASAAWGTNCTTSVWDPNGLKQSAESFHTPGSENFNIRRLISPAYYAWLDGYDSRAFADYDYYPTAIPSASRRLLYFDSKTNTTFGTFTTRRQKLQDANLQPYVTLPSKEVSWSGSIIDDCPEYFFEGPEYADFDFTTNVIPKIYLTEFGPAENRTRFCFVFKQLINSGVFPMGSYTAEHAKNPFQTMLHDNGFGKECYHFDPQVYSLFSNQYVERCSYSHTQFDDLMKEAFGYDKAEVEAITNNSHRLLVPTMASADQALSLFTRSYRNETPCTHFTKSVYGSAQTGYEAEGTITCNATFDYANGTATIEDASASFGSPTRTTNGIVKTDLPYQKQAPCAAYVNILAPGGNTGAFVDLTGIAPGETMVVEFDDLADVLEPIFLEEGASTITFDMYATYDDFWKNVRIDLRKRGTSALSRSSWRGSFTGSDTVSSAPVKALANFFYLYETSTDPSYIAERLQFPSNEVWSMCVDTESLYMFSSFCCSTNAPYFYMSGSLREYLFDNSIKPDAYGFKCTRQQGVGSSFHSELIGYYRDEIQSLCDKCYNVTGHAFHQDPAAYMQLTAGKISSIFNGEAEWEAKIAVDTLNTDDYGGVPITREYPGHYVRGGETGIVAAYTNPSISCRFLNGVSLPRERHVETYMGIVTETDWFFPQIIRY